MRNILLSRSLNIFENTKFCRSKSNKPVLRHIKIIIIDMRINHPIKIVVHFLMVAGIGVDLRMRRSIHQLRVGER